MGDRCDFGELLFRWQLDPDNGLTAEEWERLDAHLDKDPPCPYCYRQMPRTMEFLDALARCGSMLDR